MNVILLQNIKNLGKIGETVEVKPGYARNFLLPTEQAIVANENNLKQFEAKKSELMAAAQQAMEEHQKRAEQFEGKTILIATQVGDEGKLYGSITSNEIANAAKEQGLDISRKEILIEEPIKTAGEHSIKLDVYHGEVIANLTVNVVDAK